MILIEEREKLTINDKNSKLPTKLSLAVTILKPSLAKSKQGWRCFTVGQHRKCLLG